MKIAIIGAGKMGTAIAERLVSANFCPARDIAISRVNGRKKMTMANKLHLCTLTENNVAAIKSADVVILAIRPQHLLPEVITEIKAALKPEQTLISLVTGLVADRLQHMFGIPGVAQCSTNILIKKGRGLSYWSSPKDLRGAHVQRIDAILSCLGLCRRCEDQEVRIQITGSGAMLAVLLKQIITAAETEGGYGINPEIALKDVFYQLASIIEVCRNKNLDGVKKLQQSVVTKGGITAEFLEVLDSYRTAEAFQEGFAAAVAKTYQLAK